MQIEQLSTVLNLRVNGKKLNGNAHAGKDAGVSILMHCRWQCKLA